MKRFQIQLYSERCSGSNFLQACIERNIPNVQFSQPFGGKHFISSKRIIHDDALFFVVLGRSPFDWLRSLHRNPWHAAHHLWGLEFSDFIRSEWSCVWDKYANVSRFSRQWGREMLFERHPVEKRRFHNVLEMRSVKYRTWLDIAKVTPNIVYVGYEAFCAAPGEALTLLCNRMVQPVPAEIEVTPYRVRGRPHRWTRRLLRFLKGKRLHKVRIQSPLKPEDIDFISQTLDPTTESKLGFDLGALANIERGLARTGSTA